MSNLKDRVFGLLRRGSREAGRTARYAGGVAEGAAHRARTAAGGGESKSDLNDPALARKVETEIFRPADAPKGSVAVNVEAGVVHLRGRAASPEQIRALVASAEKVEGVKKVENHLTPSAQVKDQVRQQAEKRS
jgi:osmotically-inducible protein OsmY